jgi:PAS domain S-box-containing protein
MTEKVTGSPDATATESAKGEVAELRARIAELEAQLCAERGHSSGQPAESEALPQKQSAGGSHPPELLTPDIPGHAGDLRRILDSLFAFVGVATPEGTLLEANRAALDAAGIRREDAIGRPFWETYWWSYSPEIQQQLRDAIRRAASGEPVRYEVEVRIKDGELLAVDFMLSPLRDAEGRISHLIPSAIPITERKRAEKALIETEYRFQALANNIPQLAWMADENGWIFWYNRRWYEYTGTTLEEMQGWGWQKVHHPDHVNRVVERIKRSFETGEPWEDTFPLRSKDGRYRWFLSRALPIRDDHGGVARWFGTSTDITDNLEAQRHSREMEERYRALVNSASDAFYLHDLDERILDVNEKACQSLGYSREELLKMSVPDIDRDLDLASAQAICKQIQPGQPFTAYGHHRRKDGSTFPVEVMVGTVEIGGQRLFLALARDITDRERAQAALRESEARFREILENVAVGMAQIGPDGRWLYMNQRLCDILGYSKEELLNLSFIDITHPEDREVSQRKAADLLAGKIDSYSLEKRYLRKDGTQIWVNLTVTLQRDEQGRPLYGAGVVEDISERKRAEEALREQEAQLRNMIDSIDQLAWMARADGYIFWYNRRWYEYTGTTPEEVVGWGWQSVHDPNVLPEVLAQWNDQIRTGKPGEMEFPLRGADGVYRTFLTRVVPVQDSRGRVVGWFGTNTNIDNLRRERELLMESERAFRELAETVPEFVWATDAAGKQNTYLNPQWYEYTGLSKPTGSPDTLWKTAIHPDDTEHLFEEWRKALAEGKEYESEARIRRHDGAYRWFLNRGRPVRDDHGDVVKWLGTSTDIQEQKMVEEALRRSNADLEQFAYAASHDLKEPLRMVAIYTQKLIRKYHSEGEEEPQQFARYIITGVKRLESLLEGILEYSRASHGPAELTSVDTAAVVEEIVRSLEPSLTETGAKVTCSALPTVCSSKPQLVQVFQNLISNALKYRAPDRPPRIHISAVQKGRWWKFSVSDNGIGIKPAYLEQIFGIFKRLHKDEYPGAGVGLAISKRAIERQGGRIWAESEPGRGTTFYFTLAAEEQHERAIS